MTLSSPGLGYGRAPAMMCIINKTHCAYTTQLHTYGNVALNMSFDCELYDSQGHMVPACNGTQCSRNVAGLQSMMKYFTFV